MTRDLTAMKLYLSFTWITLARLLGKHGFIKKTWLYLESMHGFNSNIISKKRLLLLKMLNQAEKKNGQKRNGFGYDVVRKNKNFIFLLES